MAQFFPARNACRFDSPGERRLAERLEKKLDDDYLCWFNVPVGDNALHPDVILVHPQRGMLVLEVKDWSLERITFMDKAQARIRDGAGERTHKHPLEQAREYTFEVVKTLRKDAALKQPESAARPGQLVMPFGFGVVLSNVTRSQFEQTDLHEVLDPHKVIFQDEMTESVDSEAFQQRLWDLFPYPFHCQLSPEQLDRVRYHLFPEVRVSQQSGQFGLFSASEAPLPSLIKVMDLQQEQLARSLGDGHRVIHGVAGSGKTMILAYRCKHLAALASKPILVLCYNRSLAGRLNQLMVERGLGDKVKVRSFHAWCRELLVEHGLELPGATLSVNEKMETMVRQVVDGANDGRIPGARYAAVLIDEGHDFQPDWFRLAVRMVDGDSGSLLVLYDDAQSIYRPKGGRRLDFSFASVGIRAQGRTTILRTNYRNTLEVLSVARAFAHDLLAAREDSDDGVPTLAPESAGRRGAFPELIHCASERKEWQCLVERIRDAQAHGRALSDIAIVYRHHTQGQRAERALQEAGIPCASGLSTQGRASLYGASDSVKLVSMHSSKGLEFGLVLIPGLHEMPRTNEDESDEARLLYVAMTRAIDRLVMTYREGTGFTGRVAEAIGVARGVLA
ncbi:NERD domain-containing protein/DEAD/DEAH box helicase [Pseudomonas aeruginosa]|uniref:DEAD/DEAH box helicase n=2 Tax=Pseudomonas aeruginosa TaxID=287 RepID=UPI0005A85BEB|nr:NERD domain-containing protein/DEAD/DEAH box helicase [Pseudomonas aeruginosa]KSS19693.1 DNA helicase II [Pseudomonas aeruginosa]MBG5303847.1 NERD domain-containing protein [Pseudomonas aeruginosa]MDA3279475.1 NERD domain-containing protein [Pseudomonas aeruginosa]MDI3650567.1 NERD domain-containing protein/DEAD/DEAH box helicase [Pseudomonas aeruginosa]MDI3798672.1 NERD domain-containing protein/DEAD/DEAH box helicase [Pseudomonas aeruginosa]